MRDTQTIYKWTSLLFALAAVVTVLGRAAGIGMASVWLALSALYLVLSQKSRSDS